MTEVYLDMNVLVDCIQERDPAVVSKINELASRGAVFPYSPAHMEEVAVILRAEKDRHKAIEYVKKNIEYISELSGDWEYLPSVDSGVRLKQEHPSECLKRVVDHYDVSVFAEQNEQFVQCFRDEASYREYFDINENDEGALEGVPFFSSFQAAHGVDKRRLANLPPSQVFQQENVLSALRAKMQNYTSDGEVKKYREIKQSHREIESTVSLLLNFLEQIGYRTEERGRYRSRMHDVSHAIYATRSNYLVVGDKKYRENVCAIYDFLEVPSVVLSKEDFFELTLY